MSISTFQTFQLLPGGFYSALRSLESRLSWCRISRHQARREPQQGPGKRSGGPPNIFVRPLWGENFWFFPNGAFWCTLYLWATAGPPNLAGFGVAYPLPHPIDGPGRHRNSTQGRRQVFRARGSRSSSCRFFAATPTPPLYPPKKSQICANLMGRSVARRRSWVYGSMVPVMWDCEWWIVLRLKFFFLQWV